MDLGLRGQRILLVGGTRGIGRAVARLLAEEGARLVVVGRDPEALQATVAEVAARGGSAVPVQADVTDPAQCAQAVREAVRALGSLDVLIHAAGQGVRGPFVDLADEVWQRAVDLNLLAPVRVLRLAAPYLAPGARVVLLGAASAKQPTRGQSPSNATKAALANLTRSLADELAPRATVNCVAPGRILSERRRDRLAAEAAQEGVSLQEVVRRDAADVPLGRLGEPEEVAAVVVFLASPRARYVTGQSVVVDGGLVRAV